jgi:single-stranded-DNA-specific exonuclease
MNWKLKEKTEVGNLTYSLHPTILEILFNRGFDSPEKIETFLRPDYESAIHDPFLFEEMEKVVERIQRAKEKKEYVAIFGDYDADGVTSSSILKEALEQLGIKTKVYIPDKKLEGYGMNDMAIHKLAKEKINLIITVDCGISNHAEVETANELGINVIIVDHHHVPKKIPKAFAIINPWFPNSGYPFRELAGVGVAFKVVQAIFKKLLPKDEEKTKWMLDLVAIGTVADCVPLLGENRVIAKYGLIVLSKTKRVGLREIFKVARIQIDENNFPDTHKISFQIAPRINAAGRMNHANTAFNLLNEKDIVKARNLALELEDNNQKRQKATQKIVEEVRVLANNMFKDKKFIFAVGEHFPIGVVGLAAGKISDEFNKPTAILFKGEEISQGSFRSIPQVNIIEAIEKCSKHLLKFGGHSQAAGVTVKNKNLDAFFQELGKNIEKELKGKDIAPEIEIDAEITAKDLDFELAEQIQKLEPFGIENREPIFLMKNMVIQEIKIVGNGEKHLKFFLRSKDGSPKIFEAIGFNFNADFSHLKINDGIDIVFSIEIDSWNGNKKIQLRLIDLKNSN